MNDTCKCCKGIERRTPMVVSNRPGLDALRYRVGTHATFLETMLARLSSNEYAALHGLTTREPSDPAIAMLDAWATVADVLMFYQERIANEGYLRTATERRSVLELARLVGYALRPGVAASVYLAYTVDENVQEEVIIPKGSPAQSVPGPGESPQTFETSEELKARAVWSELKPRLTQPQYITPATNTIYLKGVSTNLRSNDPLVVVDSAGEAQFHRVSKVETDLAADRTKVTLMAKGDIDLNLVELGALIDRDRVPEEEGPYSKSIGDRAIAKVRQAMEELLVLLRDESQPASVLKHAVQVQIPRLDQTHRIFKALNFDILAGWVEKVRRQLDIVLRRLALRPEGLTILKDPAIAQDLVGDICLFLRLPPAPPSGKAYAREIGRAELTAVNTSMRELVRVLEDPQKENVEKAVAIRSEILRLAQLENVFAELQFPGPAGRLGMLCQTLEGALSGGTAPPPSAVEPAIRLDALIKPLLKPPSLPPVSSLRLARPVQRIFSLKADVGPRLLMSLQPAVRRMLYQVRRGTTVRPGPAKVYVLRAKASLFGHNVPKQVEYKNGGTLELPSDWTEWTPSPEENGDTIYLDGAHDTIVPTDYIAILKPEDPEPVLVQVEDAVIRPRTDYGISGKTTVLHLPDGTGWWNPSTTSTADFAVIRGTVVYAQSELLELAEEPIETPVGFDESDPDAGKRIEMDGLYDGLESGRWLIVFGERIDTGGASGVKDSELVMLARVTEDVQTRTLTDARVVELPGDSPHTALHLASGLAYTYKRDTVTIYGNVVKATHGETRREVLGSGDGGRALQSFTLKQPPLTYVAAPNASGVESTLKVFVNDVEWHEADTLVDLQRTDRCFVTQTDDEAKTTVVFGNGRQGARLPTGVENVRAEYRSGIGKAGNVEAGQITLLMKRPLGVKEVVNPRPASGGADKESRDQARKNAPLGVMALDRLVSVQDYADFARMFAGIGKANAVRLSDGRRELVHLTIAGADDALIEKHSDLYRNLVQALRRHGDPHQPFEVEMRELLMLIVEARVRPLPDYRWESLEPKIRGRLLDVFGFERRELGQDVSYSEVVSAVQAVPGVAYVDLDVLDAASWEDVLAFLGQEQATNLIDFLAERRRSRGEAQGEQPRKRIPVHLARPDAEQSGGTAPAQLAFLSPEVPDTLILKET